MVNVILSPGYQLPSVVVEVISLSTWKVVGITVKLAVVLHALALPVTLRYCAKILYLPGAKVLNTVVLNITKPFHQ